MPFSVCTGEWPFTQRDAGVEEGATPKHPQTVCIPSPTQTLTNTKTNVNTLSTRKGKHTHTTHARTHTYTHTHTHTHTHTQTEVKSIQCNTTDIASPLNTSMHTQAVNAHK